MLTKETQAVEVAEASSKKYVAPKLSVYGSMAQLTAAGSVGKNEGKGNSVDDVAVEAAELLSPVNKEVFG